MDISIKLNDCELIDQITRLNLIDMFQTLTDEIERLETKEEKIGDDMPDHLKIDLYDARQHKKQIESVISYISVKSDLEEFGLEHLARW